MLRRAASSSASAVAAAAVAGALAPRAQTKPTAAPRDVVRDVVRNAARFAVIALDLFCLALSLAAALPRVLLDAAYQSATDSVPASLHELLDARTMSRVSGRAVHSVRLADEKQVDLSHTTERARLRVRFEGDGHDTLVFAKTHARSLAVRVFMTVLDLYRNEVCAYSTCGARLAALGAPRVYAAKWSPSRFLLIMEDLSSINARFPNVGDTRLSQGQAEGVLSVVARLHCAYWGPGNLPPGVWTPATRPGGTFFRVVGLGALKAAVKRYPDLMTPYVQALVARVVWRFSEIDAYLNTVQPQVLTHGDTHIGNVYMFNSPDQPESEERIGLLDFQCLAQDHPMRDVAYFLVTSYDSDALAAHEPALVRSYLASLRDHGAPPAEIPTFERAMAVYRIQLAKILLIVLVGAGFAGITEESVGRVGLSRMVRAVERHDVHGALEREVFQASSRPR